MLRVQTQLDPSYATVTVDLQETDSTVPVCLMDYLHIVKMLKDHYMLHSQEYLVWSVLFFLKGAVADLDGVH